MKKIFIIDCYPAKEYQKKILTDCISRIKNIGYDIMVVSHASISEKIQEMVDYVVYDKDNTFLPSDRTPFTWVSLFDNIFRVFNTGHSLAITRNMQNGFNLAHSLGYEFFYFLEYDILFSEPDIQKLLALEQEMYNNSKHMIFFEPKDYYESNSHVYETLLFGGKLNYLLSKFIPPKNLTEWDNLNMGYTLELAFYEQLSKYSEDFLIIPEHSSSYFNNSDVNIFRYGLTIFELLYNHVNPNIPILLLYNWSINKQNYSIKVYLDNELIHEAILLDGHWWIKDFLIDNSNLKLEIYIDNELQEIKEYRLNENILEKLKLRGDVKPI